MSELFNALKYARQFMLLNRMDSFNEEWFDILETGEEFATSEDASAPSVMTHLTEESGKGEFLFLYNQLSNLLGKYAAINNEQQLTVDYFLIEDNALCANLVLNGQEVNETIPLFNGEDILFNMTKLSKLPSNRLVKNAHMKVSVLRPLVV